MAFAKTEFLKTFLRDKKHTIGRRRLSREHLKVTEFHALTFKIEKSYFAL